MSEEAPTPEQPQAEPAAAQPSQPAPAQPPVPSPAAAAAEPPATPTEPDLASDPKVRALLARQAEEHARAREAAVAEAKAAALAEAEAQAKEQAKLAQLSELERAQHELEAMKRAAADREAREQAAREQLAATEQQIAFVRALNDTGMSIARRPDGQTDEVIEEIALKRLRPLLEAGSSMADAIKSLQTTDPHLFHKPAEAPKPTGTAPSTAAPRGATPTPTIQPQGQKSVWDMTPTEYANYRREVEAGKHTFDARVQGDGQVVH